MVEFKDREGDVWHPEIRFSTLKECRRRLGIESIPQREDSPEAAEGINQQLSDEPQRLPKALYIMVKDEAEDRDMSEEDCLERFDRGPLTGMQNAISEAFIEFQLGEDADPNDLPDPTAMNEANG